MRYVQPILIIDGVRLADFGLEEPANRHIFDDEPAESENAPQQQQIQLNADATGCFRHDHERSSKWGRTATPPLL